MCRSSRHSSRLWAASWVREGKKKVERGEVDVTARSLACGSGLRCPQNREPTLPFCVGCAPSSGSGLVLLARCAGGSAGRSGREDRVAAGRRRVSGSGFVGRSALYLAGVLF